MDVIDRLPGLSTAGAYLKQTLQDKLIEHKHYINKHGQDMPEIRNWKWAPHGEEGQVDGAANRGLGSNSKVAKPEILRKAS
jgi:xylulose-5-phosphate/fructose-6-phosphate phosphoketolase